jgi:hypothetical protein
VGVLNNTCNTNTAQHSRQSELHPAACTWLYCAPSTLTTAYVETAISRPSPPRHQTTSMLSHKTHPTQSAVANSTNQPPTCDGCVDAVLCQVSQRPPGNEWACRQSTADQQVLLNQVNSPHGTVDVPETATANSHKHCVSWRQQPSQHTCTAPALLSVRPLTEVRPSAAPSNWSHFAFQSG